MTEDERDKIIRMVNEVGSNYFKDMDAKASQVEKKHQGTFIMTLTSHLIVNTIRSLGREPGPLMMDISNNVLQVFRDEEKKRSLH